MDEMRYGIILCYYLSVKFINMPEPTALPSIINIITGVSVIKRRLGKATCLNNLPAARQFVLQLLLDSRDDGGVMTLLHSIFRSDGNFSRFGVPEEKHLLRCKGDDEHWNVVFQHLPSGYLRLLVENPHNL